LLGKPFPEYSLYSALLDAALIAWCATLLVIFTCLRERLVLGLFTIRIVIGLISRFVPSLINPVAGPVRYAFLVLWILASLVTLSMFIDAVRTPHVEIEERDTKPKGRLLVLCVIIAAALLLGALCYIVPFR
jgi:hypothetical protein